MVGCVVCTHPERDAIERAILAGVSERKIAGEYGISRGAVIRHKAHVGEALLKAKEIKEVARADTILEQVQELKGRALRILDAAEAEGDLRTCCTAIREVRGVIELLAKVAGDIPPEQTNVNVLVNLDPQAIKSLGDWMATHG